MTTGQCYRAPPTADRRPPAAGSGRPSAVGVFAIGLYDALRRISWSSCREG